MSKIKARQIQTGNAEGDLVELGVGGTLPATDGSSLTNVDADTLGGQPVGTGANDIVALDGTSKLPAVDGSLLTNLPASSVQTAWGTRASTFLVANNTISGVLIPGMSISMDVVSGQSYAVTVQVYGTQGFASAGVRFFLNWPLTSFSSCDWKVAYYNPVDSTDVYSTAYARQNNLTSSSALLKTNTTNGGNFSAIGYANFKSNSTGTYILQLQAAQRVATVGDTTFISGMIMVASD